MKPMLISDESERGFVRRFMRSLLVPAVLLSVVAIVAGYSYVMRLSGDAERGYYPAPDPALVQRVLTKQR